MKEGEKKMTVAMTAFDIYAQLEGIYNKYKDEVNDFIYYAKANSKKMGDASLAIHGAAIKYLGRQPSIDPNDSKFDEKSREQIFMARELPSYSVMNVLAWIKRFRRLEYEFSSRYHHYKRAVKEANEALEKLQEQLTPKQRKNETISERVTALEAEFMAEMYAGFEWERSEMDLYSTISFLLFKISKNDMLSLFSLRHEELEKKYIDELPDTITPKEFEQAAFVYKLEDDNDCIFFDIYFDNFMKHIKNNKETSEMAFDVMQEVFGPIQTYTIHQDKHGNIVKMEPNKPNLQVISNEQL